MKKHVYILITVLSAYVAVVSCQKKTEAVPSGEMNEYMPLQIGKFIHYRLDSTRYIDFGRVDTVISYDAKDVVDGEITDNLNRPGFRIVRYLRDIASTNESDWSPSLTYWAIPTRESVEIIENNLRFLKLRIPVKDGYSWHGNSFLPSTPFYSLYQFSNDEDIDVWDYTYQDVNQSVTIGNTTYDSTASVIQIADSANVPITFPDGLAYRNYWIEQYAKNIGLIYKEVAMWEYQPPKDGRGGFKSGFGIKMSIIDHN